MRGFLDFVGTTEVRGWIWDPERPDERITVRVELLGLRLAETSASRFRQDLVKNGIGDGNHAFVATFDAPISEADCSLVKTFAIRADGKTFILPRSDAIRLPEPLKRIHSDDSFSPDSTQYPIFVLGAARSGTSIMGSALLSVGRYVGRQEGHVLDMIPELRRTVAEFIRSKGAGANEPSVLLSDIGQQFFDQAIYSVFRALMPRAYGTPFWIDKTPTATMIHAAPHLLAIWPNARFIFMRRRAYENIASRGRKFPGDKFAARCRDWGQAMEAWSHVRDNVRGCAIEIDQYAIASAPAEVASEVSAFLGFDTSDTAKMRQTFETQRPEQTGSSLFAVCNPITDPFDADEARSFELFCRRWMSLFGYSDDTTYFSSEGSGIRLVV